jgi:hypothetical protein
MAVLAAMLTTFLSAPAAQAAVTPPWDPFFADPTTAADVAAVAPVSTSSNRAYGLAAGDYDEDGDKDLIVGRADGRIVRLSNTGNGTFAPPALFTWKQTTFNAWSFSPADVNADGNLDVVWGATATLSTGCSVSPIPAGQNCTTAGGTTVTVNDGEVRAFLGNGNGTFQENQYFVSGIRHNAGTLITDIGTDAGTITSGDVDGDTDTDLVVGSLDATSANATVKLLRSNGLLGFGAPETIISQAQGTTAASPIYFPIQSAAGATSPWGLSLSDMNADGDLDLWVGDRALYVYRYNNTGGGTFALQTGNSGLPAGRENAYLDHDTFRASVGFTPALGSGDINGDGKADLALGLQSGNQATTSTTIAHDGEILMDASAGTSHTVIGPYADIGTAARSVAVADFTGDGYLDIAAGTAEGRVHLLRQLTPVDTDGDGVSDYVDNAPEIANAARIDMDTDGSINHRDQLDNDFDTVLGDPEDTSTWTRLGDPADADDDNDGVNDGPDNCAFTANAAQDDVDGDGAGDACDPLDDRDPDGDGVPTGPLPGDPLYDEALAATQLWSQGDTHFVIRIDALGRIFQNEFTQLMSDAAALSDTEWATKCWENYGAGDPVDPCGTGEGTASQTLTLEGGKSVPVTTVTIPRLLWTDPPVIDWINDRNNNVRFELGQHGTYHDTNTSKGEWASDGTRNFFSCEACGLTEAESYERFRIGNDTLLGNYDNMWLEQSGATASSPKIDWSTSAHPLISYAPPFNADDATARGAIAQLGFKAHSSSVFEENSPIFTPEGTHHEDFDQFGMFHSSADLELEPPDTAGGTYDASAYANYLASETQPGELNTWLIEEVEWSGRPCNDAPRLNPDGTAAPITCPEGAGAANNRENNTVYGPRWDGWMQLLDYVHDYPGGVAMTMGDVALAKAFDNAPTVANADQADSDHDGVGDVIDGAMLVADDGASLSRNEAGTLSATLTNGAAAGIPGQSVEFSFDVDGDDIAETYEGTTDAAGLAEVSVTPTRSVGPATYDVSWDGRRVTAADSGDVSIADSTDLQLDASNPSSGQVTDQVTVGATLRDSDNDPLQGQTVDFSIGSAGGSGSTDSNGHATATLTLQGPAGAQTLEASFAGAGPHGSSDASTAFTVNKETTTVALPDAIAQGNAQAVAVATLTEQDGAPLAGRIIEFQVEEKRGKTFVWTSIGTATTNGSGMASKAIAKSYVSKNQRPIRAVFAGDADFLGSTGNAFTYR